jgi:hypothetical protein
MTVSNQDNPDTAAAPALEVQSRLQPGEAPAPRTGEAASAITNISAMEGDLQGDPEENHLHEEGDLPQIPAGPVGASQPNSQTQIASPVGSPKDQPHEGGAATKPTDLDPANPMDSKDLEVLLKRLGDLLKSPDPSAAIQIGIGACFLLLARVLDRGQLMKELSSFEETIRPLTKSAQTGGSLRNFRHRATLVKRFTWVILGQRVKAPNAQPGEFKPAHAGGGESLKQQVEKKLGSEMWLKWIGFKKKRVARFLSLMKIDTAAELMGKAKAERQAQIEKLPWDGQFMLLRASILKLEPCEYPRFIALIDKYESNNQGITVKAESTP